MGADILLVLHFHQPVGNFGDVIRRICDDCYRPFLQTLQRHPRVKMNIHISGNLLEWFASNTPELLRCVAKMVQRGQVELVGGPFYEPILSVIPQRDRNGQLELMKQSVSSIFQVDVKGAWIPERVWEPHMVSDLAKGGAEYIVLDDTHLLYAGIKKEDTYGYYVTEDNGRAVRVFASDKTLRYTIPFREPEESFAYMKAIVDEKKDVIFTYGDDVEKFGAWPGTNTLVYEKKWLDNFFRQLLEHADWLTTAVASECLQRHPPLGRVYLPPASYEEMLEWVLPLEGAEAYQEMKRDMDRRDCLERYMPFIRGGFFRNFFVKYYEANQMHKRMMYVSNLLGRLQEKGEADEKLQEARRELYKGQCNCAYWHGLFGGLYLHHLRDAVYRHLLRAENMYHELTWREEKPAYETVDFDADGFDEVIISNSQIWLCICPSAGGTVTEFDVRRETTNILNVLTRYREHYHNKMFEEIRSDEYNKIRLFAGASDRDAVLKGLFWDRYRKTMFVDHFFSKRATLSDFEKGEYPEEGDFIGAPYDWRVRKGSVVTMEREGRAYDTVVHMIKELAVTEWGVRLTARITNTGSNSKEFWYGVEIPFVLPAASSAQYRYFFGEGSENGFPIDSRGELRQVRDIYVADREKKLGLSLALSKEGGLWRFPLVTVSRYEQGYEGHYQGSVLLPHWQFELSAGESLQFECELNINLYK